MGSPQRESFDANRRYKGILWIKEREAQDWSLNEDQMIQDLERKRFGDRVFKEGAIVEGLAPSFPATGQIAFSEGKVWTQGRAEPISAVTLSFGTGATTGSVNTGSTSVPIGANPTTLGFASSGTAHLGGGSGALDAFAYTGVDATGFTGVTGISQTWASGTKVVKNPAETIWGKWLLDQITLNEDTSLKAPATGQAVEERIRTTLSLVTSNPDALDELFELFDGSVPRNWTLASGVVARGYPGKFGETALKLVHTNGTTTEVSRPITLAPNTAYTVYFHVRTVDGKTDLSLAHGAFVDFQRTSPAWNPTDFIFATSALYARKTFSVTADGNVEDANIRIVIPASAPSTEILVDAVLVTTSTLAALDLDRHHAAVLFWNRATDTVTRAVPRASNLRMADLEPPLSGADIVDIDLNPGLQDLLAGGTFDEHGHYRVPPGLVVERDTTLDTASLLGLRASAGRAYVLGYLVRKATSTPFTVAKALTTARVLDESKTFTYGVNLYQLNKNAGADMFPIEEILDVTAQVVEVLTITRGGTAGGTDALGVTSVTAILSASGGTSGGSSAGSLTGTATGPFVFTEANNRMRLKVSKYDGTAGTFQDFYFARGSYTIAEVVQALSTGSGRAYRSGRPFDAGHDNVVFENDGSGHLRMRAKTKSTSSSVQIDSEANGSTCNTLLGFNSLGATGTGTGVHWAATTQFLQSGNSIDWSPGADVPGTDEPESGLSYTVVVRRNKALILNTDVKLGGIFASTVTYFYKVAAWGPDGEGLPSSAVSRSTPVGSINKLSWAAVTNAVSYHVYRSSDGGTTYNLLKNTTDTFFVDDGSMAPDSGKTPETVQTTLNGALSGGETTVTVVSTTGFPTGGTRTAFIEGSDVFTYTGTSATTFTGVPGSGGNAVVAHATGAAVRMGPDMGALTLIEDVLGVANFNPQGQDPEHAQAFVVDYDYFQPRVDRVALDRYGALSVIVGVPADQPLPPAMPDPLMELAQVRATANSTTLTIQNLKAVDRPTVRELRFLMDRVEELRVNDLSQEILNQIDTKTTAAKKGLFADGMASEVQHDPNHSLYTGFLNIPFRNASIQHDGELRTVSDATLSVNGGTTTCALLDDTFYLLTSTEITLLSQLQWSEEMLVNPYSAFTPPPAAIRVQPDRHRWTLRSPTTVWSNPVNMRNRERLVQALRRARIATLPVPLRPGETLESVLEGEQRAVLENLAFYRVQPITLRVTGWDFLANEDNIACTFGGVARNLTPISPTVAGTNPNTVKADATGRLTATFQTTELLTPGTYDVQLKGATSTAITSFTALLRILPPPPPAPKVDPLAMSFSFTAPKTLSAIGLYFTAKDATLPIRVQIRDMVAGFPGQTILVEKTLAPADITLGAETKVTIPYLRVPANTSLCLALVTTSNAYKVQTATLGKSGRNPAAWITAQPYEAGVLFSSSNAESWTVHQETDLRFVLYGRAFSTSEQILEFTSVTPGLTPANYSDLWLGADEDVPEGTTVTWEFELSGDGVPRPFGPFEKRLLDSLATSVIVRARLRTTNADISPTILRYSAGIAGYLNALAGVIVWRKVDFAQNLSSGHIYVTQALPSGTGVTWYMSNDDGGNWRQMQQLGAAVPVDTEWSEYTYEMVSPGTFPATTDKRLRLRADMTATSRLVMPRVARVGATVE